VKGGLGVPASAEGRRVALIVSYDGAGFAGFQRQPGVQTVQSALEAALADLAGAAVVVRGAGRTDAGVHAAGQVVDFALPALLAIPTPRLPLALASRLPPGIAAAAAYDVPAGFHARKGALGKRYRFLIWRPGVTSPFWRAWAWPYAGRLDVPAMQAAAGAFVGRQDFAAVAGAARPVADATRTLVACTVYADGPWVAIEVEADGFLYRMVRAIAGTLVAVGRGALPAAEVPRILRDGRRAAAGPSLPAHGLCLLWVRYGPPAGLPPPGHPDWPVPPGPPLWRPSTVS